MTVYVHKLRGQSHVLFGKTATPDPWFSLTADTEDELHAFAARLSLTRTMFRPATPAGSQAPVAGHYVISHGEHDRAVALGAQAISPAEAEEMARLRSAGLG